MQRTLWTLAAVFIILVILAFPDKDKDDKKPPETKKPKGDKDISGYLKSYDDGHLEEIKKAMEDKKD